MARPVGVIERGVKIPRTNKEIHPFGDLEIGDSLFFRNRDYWDINVLRFKAERRHGITLTMRKVNGGVRVWRVPDDSVATLSRNVPLPTGGRGARRKYPFAEMNVGESFLMNGFTHHYQAGPIVYRAARSLGRKFSIRRTAEGLRVWRTE